MKVLLFNHSFFNISETFIYQQINALPSEVNASLLAFDLLNENVFPLPYPRIKIRKYVNFTDKLITAGLRRLTGFQLGFSIFEYFVVKRFLKKSKFDFIHAHFGSNALQILPVAQSLKIPVIVSFHGVDASPQFLKNPTYTSGLAKLFAYAQAIIIVSPHMRDTLNLEKWREKTHLIPYGVNAEKFVRPTDQTAVKNTVSILHSGRLVSKKGVPDLIRVFVELRKRYDNIELNIIGDGPELEQCKTIAAQSGVDSINFFGAKPHAEVQQFMMATHIFVLNSRTSENGDMEGLPNAILEAMSMRLPVLSTYHAGIPQAIDSGKNGLLVNERDNNSLQHSLEQLIVDAQFRNRLGEAARETIEQRFTLQRMNDSIFDVYRKVPNQTT